MPIMQCHGKKDALFTMDMAEDFTGKCIREAMNPEAMDLFVDEEGAHEMTKDTFKAMNEFIQNVITPVMMSKDDF